MNKSVHTLFKICQEVQGVCLPMYPSKIYKSIIMNKNNESMNTESLILCHKVVLTCNLTIIHYIQLLLPHSIFVKHYIADV